MKNNLKIVCVIILSVSLILPITYSYAIATGQTTQEKQFFEISELEVAKNEKIEMTLNLDAVEYNEFVFELQSDEVIEDVEISQNNNIETEKKNHEITMEISKDSTNVNTVNLYYTIPENKKVGDTIKFVATVTSIVTNETETNTETSTDTDTNTDVSTDTDTDTNTISSAETDTNTSENEVNIDAQEETSETVNTTEQIQETQSIEFEVKIVEETDEESDTKKISNSEKLELEDDKALKQKEMDFDEDDKEDKEKSSLSNSASQSLSGSQTATVVYNGSDNNYLSELSIKDYTLNKDFSKENSTYFITVESEIEELDITVSAEDDDATVCVYGNEDLKEGMNKILISVTAENGNVRNYRIYVTKNS